MVKSKVLVAAPIYEAMDYCIDRFILAVKSLKYENFDMLFVDNSRDQNFFRRLKDDKGLLIVPYISDEKKNLKRLVESRNIILRYAKEHFYDYVLMMDSDVIPPANIISELIKCDKDIISGLYFNYFRYGGKLVKLPGAWRKLKKGEFEELKAKELIPEEHSHKDYSDLQTHLIASDVASRKPIEVTMPSAGCMLIKKHVFEKLGYKIMINPLGNTLTDESYFILEAVKKGFSVYCHTGLVCDHLISGKYKKGDYSHPIRDVR